MRSTSLSASILSAFAVVSLFIASHAYAAGSIVITQQSPIGAFGDYSLTFPSGGKVSISQDEWKEFVLSEAGTYTLAVTPPAYAGFAATVTIGTDVVTTTQKNITFTLADGDAATIALTYSYQGTIIVDSTPTKDVSFELLGPNGMRFTGTTPATFTNLPPAQYRATFQKQSGCYFTSPMQRNLQANETLTLTAQFVCGSPEPAPAPVEPTPPPPAEEPVETGRTVRIWIAAHQAEALPGGTVQYTITVKNTGTRTVHDLDISAQFDPAFLQAISPLPRFGTMNGDVLAWHTSELYAGQYWTVNVPMTISKDLAQGDRTSITARVSGSDVTATDQRMLVASAEVGVVTGLPQTGVRFDILFLVLSIATAFLITQGSKKFANERA